MQTDQPTDTPPVADERDTRLWAMALHLSQFAGYLVPLAGFIVPIVIWQLKKDEYPELDAHGKIVTNWILSSFIYATVLVLLCFVFIGFFLLPILGIMGVVFPIVGGSRPMTAWRGSTPFRFRFSANSPPTQASVR